MILINLQKSQSILIIFYSVNAMFYFQSPALDMGSTCMSNFLTGSDSVVWFGFFSMGGLEWFMLIYLIIIVWRGFGLDPKKKCKL